MTTLEESEEFAIALLVIGISISRPGDAKRITDFIQSDMLRGNLASRAMAAIKIRNRPGIVEFLSGIGVAMVDGETAVDAVIRTFLDIQEARVEAHRNIIRKMRASERTRMEKRTDNAGNPNESEENES